MASRDKFKFEATPASTRAMELWEAHKKLKTRTQIWVTIHFHRLNGETWAPIRKLILELYGER
jgi:hypothetical protein